METINENRNDIFKRQEIILTANENLTFNDAKKQIAEQLKKPEENIDVYNVQGSFGNKTFTIKANIYDSKEDLDKIKKLQSTSKQRKEDKKPIEVTKTEDKPAEEPTKEETAEEPTEETKEEKETTEKEPAKEPTEDTKEESEDKKE